MSGEKGVVDLDNLPPAGDDDEDLSKLDRGDDLPNEGGDDDEDPDKKQEPARGADGRFKKDPAKKEDDEEDDEEDEDDEPAPKAKRGKKAEEEEEEDEDEEDEDEEE